MPPSPGTGQLSPDPARSTEIADLRSRARARPPTNPNFQYEIGPFRARPRKSFPPRRGPDPALNALRVACNRRFILNRPELESCILTIPYASLCSAATELASLDDTATDLQVCQNPLIACQTCKFEIRFPLDPNLKSVKVREFH